MVDTWTPSKPLVPKRRKLTPHKSDRNVWQYLIIGGGIILLSIVWYIHFLIESNIARDSVHRDMLKLTKQKIGDHTRLHLDSNTVEDPTKLLIQSVKDNLPAFDKFWIPINVFSGPNPNIILCKLDLNAYTKSPHDFAMFRELVSHSHCGGSNSKVTSLNDWKQSPEYNSYKAVKPSGFIFHESRVGSTLAANFFASDPYTLVFSESSIATIPLMHCDDCVDDIDRVERIKNLFDVLGRSPYHKRLVFKFQSSTVPKMKLVLQAFPDTPWIFLYRDPVQTLMSHLAPDKLPKNARMNHNQQLFTVCSRQIKNPPPKVQKILQAQGSLARTSTTEEYCAAHLRYLTDSAMEALEQHGNYSSGGEGDSSQPRGMLVDYASLPGSLVNIVLKHFNINLKTEVNEEWLLNAYADSNFYSKGIHPSTRDLKFAGDVKKKNDEATPQIVHFAGKYLSDNFKDLQILTKKAFKYYLEDNISSKIYSSVGFTGPEDVPNFSPIMKWGIEDRLQHSSVGGDSVLEEENLKNGNGVENAWTTNHVKKEGAIIQSMVRIDDPEDPLVNDHHSVAHETVKCPTIPDKDYPKHYPILDVIGNWNPDSRKIPKMHYDSLCHFDWQNEEEKEAALNYRNAEVPFVVYNHPEVDATAKRWLNPEYVSDMLGDKEYTTEASHDNHFMYWTKPSKKFKNGHPDWENPTVFERITFSKWYDLATKGHTGELNNTTFKYFRASAGSDEPWLKKELPYFKRSDRNFFVVNAMEQHGIHCRFGMRSVVAEAHWDGSRNMVALLGGLRRWIMSHPRSCPSMYIYPKGHPCGRHSSVDWTKPNLEKFPEFINTEVNEVILKPGDVLYIPTDWIHYIHSLGVNYQCNTRSGSQSRYAKFTRQCRNNMELMDEPIPEHY